MMGFILAVLLGTAPPPTPPTPGPIAAYLQNTDVGSLRAEKVVQAQPRKDPLRNGARIGAIVGGSIMAVATTYLCLATHEQGDPSCVGPIVLWSALGAGAGALAGAGIDALFDRPIVVRYSVRF